MKKVTIFILRYLGTDVSEKSSEEFGNVALPTITAIDIPTGEDT